MRTSTFFVSFTVHALLIGAVVVTRVVANDVLPQPPRATTFIMVTPEVPTAPPAAPVRRPVQAAPVVSPDAAPLVAPPEIQPEAPRVVDDLPDSSDLAVAGADLPGAGVQGDGIAPPPPPNRPAAVAPLRIGGDIRPPRKIHHVAPEYPPIARSAGVSGIVILEAVIAEDGAVRELSVLRSAPLLDEAAVQAVRQWRFTPTLLNGQPVAVIMTVTVAFNLQR